MLPTLRVYAAIGLYYARRKDHINLKAALLAGLDNPWVPFLLQCGSCGGQDQTAAGLQVVAEEGLAIINQVPFMTNKA